MISDAIAAISMMHCTLARFTCHVSKQSHRNFAGAYLPSTGRLAAIPGGRSVRDRSGGLNPFARVPTRLVRSAICALLVISLAGCIWAPGQSMSRKSSLNDQNSLVELVPITPALLETQEQNAEAVSTSAIPTALLNYQPEAYRIGAGDSLYVTVWDHPELTSPAGQQQPTAANGRLVRPDGTLYFPYAGVVKVAGKTIEQARQAIASGLSRFIKNPLVDVNVVDYGSQRVLMEGAFVKAGGQPVTGVPLTLGEAIGAAGVNSQEADLSNVVLSRQDQVYHLDLNAVHSGETRAQMIYLRPGDRIFLPYNFSQEVYVMGEVVRPQALRFSTSHLNLTQALGQAGGLNETTSRGMLYVVRGALHKLDAAQRPTVYELDAKSPAAFALADGFMVKPGDVVFASAAGITRWNRFMSQLLPLTSALSATASSQYYLGK